jgi:predicted nucleotidyltransferase
MYTVPRSAREKSRPSSISFLNTITTDPGDQVVKVIVFGSVSRGQATDDSDIDLLVVMKSKDYRIRRQLIRHAYDIFLETGRLISVKAISETDCKRERDFSHLSEIAAEGVRVA